MGISFYRKSLDEIKGGTAWSAAEEQLLEEAHTGIVFISETRPEETTDAHMIRAELIRHITLGGCEKLRVPDKGIAIAGAFITDELDLQGCDTPLDVFLVACHFDTQPVFRDARLGALYLPGCMLPGLDAHRLRVKRGVLLN
ncbi:hypothetical protein [Roseivivax sp. THAF30]|uniref:hypothetical protein n=1 Tax=Roseivivax sp. THAF30 TaxID=2587852 RepID=UPI001267C0EC|nr:hypothetical protein [Roseivivax sp. THAF30]QFT62211.1 hypothetical protein FIU91_04655 [Roseivivax sp. THAF30]